MSLSKCLLFGLAVLVLSVVQCANPASALAASQGTESQHVPTGAAANSPTSSTSRVESKAASGSPGEELIEQPAPVKFPTAQANLPSDWKIFIAEEYGWEIGYPSDWPINFSGNKLTIGDTKGDGHTTCYVTVEFYGSKREGSIRPIPDEHSKYDRVENGERCMNTLTKILKSARFVK